jgi:hypothetical protein
MNGELAALVAVCLHGNEWLASGHGPAPAVDTANSSFRFVERVHVTCRRRRLVGTTVWQADGVAAWLRFLKESRVERLALATAASPRPDLPEPIAASFANGGRWGIVSDGSPSRLWQSRWSVHDRNRPDQRIWVVEFAGTRLRSAPVHIPAPTSAAADLRAALEAIRAYAETAALDPWTAWFTEALRLLDAPDPVIPYNPDLAPASLPVESHRLLAAAVQAWVFGGMGSWNDVAIADATLREEYDRLSGDLYRSILAALTAVTSSGN